MKKILFFILIGFTSQIVKSQPKNYVNTENATLKDAFPKNPEKVAPGCLGNDQLKELKLFLKEKWNMNLDSVKTLHFYYSKDKKECKSVKAQSIEKNKYFRYEHSYNVTSIYKPILYIKSESIKADSFWKDDISDYLFNLFLKDTPHKFYTAAITIDSRGIYFIDYEVFNPVVFNAFSNEVGKYSCN